MVPYCCCCYGCNERYVKGGSVTFHNFPRDEQIARIWLQNIYREDFVPSRYSRVCSKHFTEDCFYRDEYGAVRLKSDAVPTVVDFSNCPPKGIGRKRPHTRSMSGSRCATKGSAQSQEELLASIQRRFVPILPAPSTSANSKGKFRVWGILLPVAPKPEQTRPGVERTEEVTTSVGKSNNVENDSAANNVQSEVDTKKKAFQLHSTENRIYLLCNTVNLEEKHEKPSVKEDPTEDHDESTTEEEHVNKFIKQEPEEDLDEPSSSATEEECENTLVKQEPADDPLGFPCPAAEEECEFTFVKEEPDEDLDEPTCTATEEECEYTLVEHEPADDPLGSPSPADEEVFDKTTVEMEPEPQYEENSCERHREQETECVEVKDEPLEVEDLTYSDATDWVSRHFWDEHSLHSATDSPASPV